MAAISLLILKKKYRTKIAADISSTSENHIITELLKVIPFYDPMNKIIQSIARNDYQITHLV